MILRILLIAACLALAAYGGYVLFGNGKVVRVEVEKPTVDSDKKSVTIEAPKVTVEKS